MRRLTASSVGLASLCRWWARPDVALPPQVTTAAAERGTDAHATFDYTIRTGKQPERMSAEVRALYQSWFAEWATPRAGQTWFAEVPLAVDPFASTGRVLPSEFHRDYSAATPREVPGTVDAYRFADGVVEIADFKTGHHAPDAPGNGQLLTLALAATLREGATRARISIVHVRPDAVRVDEIEVDEFDLDAHRRALAGLLVAIKGSEPNPGPHCRALYCPANGVCPATSSALERVAPQAPKTRLPVVLDAAKIQGPEHAAELYAVARYAQSKLGYLWQALREYTDKHGAFDVGDGTQWGPRTSRRESIDLSQPGAVEAIRRLLGEHAELALEKSTSKVAIRNAARALATATDAKIAPIERRVLDELRALGAVAETESTKHEEVKPKKEIAA